MEIGLSDILLRLMALVIGYLLGSILFAKILVRIFTGKDIEEIGDKNPGAKNTMINVGVGIGLAIGILDALKAWAPIVVAFYVFKADYFYLFLIGAGAVAGHMYPLYFHFKGGRAIACLIGFFLFFIPHEVMGAAVVMGLIYIVKFLLKKKFMISLSKLMIATVIVSLFMPHFLEIKIIVFNTLLVALFNRSNLAAFKEWFDQIIKTVEK